MLVRIAFMILGTLGLVGVTALWHGPVGFVRPAAGAFAACPWGRWRIGPRLFNPRLFRPRLFGPPLFGPRSLGRGLRWGRGWRRW